MARKFVVFSKIINWSYPHKHSRNLFYHIQMVMHNLQVIQHEHPSHINLIINTLLQIKIITTPQIQMTSTHLEHYKNKITVFRPHLRPLGWRHWTIHYLLYLLSYTEQQKLPLLVNNISVFIFTVDLLMLPSVSNHG